MTPVRAARRYGLRVLPGYPVPQYVGDVITYGNSTREQVETIRGQMKATGQWHEVVELDDAGEVIEPKPCAACARDLWHPGCTNGKGGA